MGEPLDLVVFECQRGSCCVRDVGYPGDHLTCPVCGAAMVPINLYALVQGILSTAYAMPHDRNVGRIRLMAQRLKKRLKGEDDDSEAS